MQNDRIIWSNKNNKDILLADFSNLKLEEIISLIEECKKAYVGKKLKSIYSIMDMTNTVIVSEIYKKFKELDLITAKYDVKSAVVGLNKAKEIFLNLVNHFNSSDVKGFNSREDAMKWLLQ